MEGVGKRKMEKPVVTLNMFVNRSVAVDAYIDINLLMWFSK